MPPHAQDAWPQAAQDRPWLTPHRVSQPSTQRWRGIELRHGHPKRSGGGTKLIEPRAAIGTDGGVFLDAPHILGVACVERDPGR
jgi:hypothetical protein